MPNIWRHVCNIPSLGQYWVILRFKGLVPSSSTVKLYYITHFWEPTKMFVIVKFCALFHFGFLDLFDKNIKNFITDHFHCV